MMPWEQFFRLVVQLLILFGVAFLVSAAFVGIARNMRDGK